MSIVRDNLGCVPRDRKMLGTDMGRRKLLCFNEYRPVPSVPRDTSLITTSEKNTREEGESAVR